MKAKETTWKGMKFRSKLEARYYNHFKNLKWDFDYEPDVQYILIKKETVGLKNINQFQIENQIRDVFK